MLSQKTFIKLMNWKGWIPVDTGERLIWLKGSDMVKGSNIRYYLTFKEHDSFRCLCSRENRDKILNF